MMNAPWQTHAAPQPKQLDENQRRVLEQQGFTAGLIHTLSQNVNTIPLRIFVVDNSVSMQVRDGHRFSGSTFQNLSQLDCSRWEEAQDEIALNAYMAGMLGLPTRFNMVAPQPNVPGCFSVGEHGPAQVQNELNIAKQIMGNTQPIARSNPLAQHLWQIRGMVAQMAPQLQREGKSVSIVLVTAGLPTDEHGQSGPSVVQQFLQALGSLGSFPALVTVRLCTDEEAVVGFYNLLDAQLKYDFVDDFFGESLEVYLKNPWLNYALPLHRFREFGFDIPVLDELDERALSFQELREFCAILFYSQPPQFQPFPDPAINWTMFLRALHFALSREKTHFNPISKTLAPWIDLRRLHRIYGGNLQFPADIPLPPSPQHASYHQQSQRATFQQPTPEQSSTQHYRHRYQPQQQQQHYQQQQHHQQQHYHHQQQQRTQTGSVPPSASGAPVSKYFKSDSTDESITGIKHGIVKWATAPPSHQQLRSIDQLLGTLGQAFPPAFGVPNHDYFKKWKPFSVEALQDQDEAVLKRAMRKTKFFLHPDKLPKDATKEQSLLFKMLWDIIADSWEAFETGQQT